LTLNLSAWLSEISAQHPKTIALGLERVDRVAHEMGFDRHPDGLDLGCTTIIVGGTNGKGSTCAMLESILVQAGYRVATYTSPHLIRFNERLRFQCEAVSDAALIESFERVEAARQRLPDSALTYFEFTTLAIFDQIRRAEVDVAVLEIGLGGRLDAVNCAQAHCSVLVSVDLDHQDYLGESREAIGWEKAHIARSGRPFICADPEPPATVLQVVESIGALRGANQLLNASAALATLTSLRDLIPVTQGAVRQGLALVEIAGRFQVFPGQPAVVLDVAHNPHAAAVLAVNLDQMGFFPTTIAVVGILGGKDAARIFERIGDRVDHWCLASLTGADTGGRARRAEELELILRTVNPKAKSECFETPELAYLRAQTLAQPSDRIVAFGSFLTVAPIFEHRHAR
jgi:dihydrofolate synthase/folylpolyglutamate synthase